MIEYYFLVYDYGMLLLDEVKLEMEIPVLINNIRSYNYNILAACKSATGIVKTRTRKDYSIV